MRVHAAFSVAILAASCGPATTTNNVAKPSGKPVAPPAPAAKPTESPARWVLLPSGAVTADARLEIPGVGTLYVGHSGDRWLEKKGAGLVAAESLIPEPVRGVLRDESGRYAFVGASGAVHLAKDPLGPVVETRAAKAKLTSVSVGQRAIVGIARHGQLLRSTDLGATWSPATAPKVAGALLQLAMRGGEGLALIAPQQILATTDDGATWQLVATPGVGARRVVADANGDLILEGLTASAVLRTSPLRLEKIARAPSAGWELPVAEAHGVLLGSDAVFSGAAAIVGDRYVEAVQDPDFPERWRIATAELGKTPTMKQPAELEHCDRVFVTGLDKTIIAGCVNPTNVPGSMKSKWGPMPSWQAQQMKLFRSTDGGATFKEEGLALASDREKLMWLSPDGVLLVDGACKRSHSDYECSESPPVVRPPGAKSFAKAVSATGTHFERVAFAPNGRAFAIGSDQSAKPFLYVSSNGGRDFTRKGLPPVMDDKGNAHNPISGGGAVGADESGVYVIARSDTGSVLRYAAGADGTGLTGRVVDVRAESLDLHGRRGFGYDPTGKAYETADGGATWKRVAAPAIHTSLPTDRLVACSAYGCLLGDRATRLGWDLALGTAAPAEPGAPAKKIVGRTPFKCTAEGEWKTFSNVNGGGTANADLGGNTRWVIARRDPQKASLSAVIGTTGAKGLDVKELNLLGPAGVDTAGVTTLQVEGVAALRYAFKRDTPPTKPTVKPPPTGKVMPAAPYNPYKAVAITPKQLVDVEVAWYRADTGKVYRGTIKGAGPLDPSRDVVDSRDKPSQARTALLSIGAGGIHVRPFQSASGDAPLYFISEAGKVEKLVWPEIPTKDVRGRNLSLRVDAARLGGRSIVFGDTAGGVQLFLATANAAGTAWESRTWGLWPDLEERDGWLRFVESGDKPVLGVIAPHSDETVPAGFAVPLAAKADPEVIATIPSQKQLPDPPRACGKSPPPWRTIVPYATGTRHPVTVTSDGRELLFATSNVVVRSGTTGEACVSAIDGQQIGAAAPKGGVGEWYSMLIPPDDLAHATLFRIAWKSTGNETSMRPMSCTMAPGPVPDALANVDGFVD